MNDDPITVQTTIDAPLEAIWACWTKPEHITGWAFASEDWEATSAENDLREDGVFKTTMAARDGSIQFDLTGSYTFVLENKCIEYELDDGRQVRITFEETPDGILITETFDPENENSLEEQRLGWQAILDNFKKYTQNHTKYL